MKIKVSLREATFYASSFGTTTGKTKGKLSLLNNIHLIIGTFNGTVEVATTHL